MKTLSPLGFVPSSFEDGSREERFLEKGMSPFSFDVNKSTSDLASKNAIHRVEDVILYSSQRGLANGEKGEDRLMFNHVGI